MVVTGANGFLGSYLVAALLSRGNTVTGTKREGSDITHFDRILQNELGNDYIRLIGQFRWKEADILDICTLDEVLEGEDIVFHCAAKVAFNKREKENMQAVNVAGTANIVNACLRSNIQKLVYVSSTAALGRSEKNGMITEERDWEDSDQNTHYAVTKHLAELEVWRGIEEGLNAVIVNPGIILGAGDWQTGSCRLFKNVDEGFKFYTKGINGFVCVKDVAEVMAMLAGTDISAERFLLVAENRSYQYIFNTIADALQKKRPAIELKKSSRKLLMTFARLLQFFNPRATVTPETVNTSMKIIEYDSSKIIKALGEFQFTPISECISRAGDSYTRSFT